MITNKTTPSNEVNISYTPNKGVQSISYNKMLDFIVSCKDEKSYSINVPAPILKLYNSGGLGSGKSYSTSQMFILLAFFIKQKYPKLKNYDFMVVAPTHDMVMRVCAKTIIQNLENFGLRKNIDFRFNKSEKLLTIFNEITIKFVSGNDPERIAGDNIIGCWADEIDLMSCEVLNRLFARVRFGGVKLPKFILLSGTPEVNNVEVEPYITDFEVFQFPTVENLENVGFDYIERMKKTMTPEEQQCYLYGKRVKIDSDIVFYHFKRQKHVLSQEFIKEHDISEIWKTLDLYVSMDFNVNPFVACLWQLHNLPLGKDGEDKEVFVLKRVIELKNLNTDAMIDAVNSEYQNGRGRIHCSPDSNKGRDTGSDFDPWSGQASDYTKMQNAGWIVHKNSRNPRIWLSVQLTNSCLNNMDLVFIENDSTRNLINIMDSIKWDKNGRMAENIKHYPDSVRYLIWTWFSQPVDRRY